MKTLLIALFTLITPLLFSAELPTDVSKMAKPPTIKVLISKNARAILLEARGRYNIYNPETNLLITSGATPKMELLLPTDKGLRWGDSLPSFVRLRFVPGDSQSSFLVNGIQYRGCVEAYLIDNKIHIINEIDMENYLKSILTSALPDPMHREVMDALAIIARTNAAYAVFHNPSSNWHVTAPEVGYEGYGVTFQNLHIDQAVENTRHMILSYSGAPFPAEWTRNSAGKTAAYSTIFRKADKAPLGIETPLAARDREKSKWNLNISTAALAKAANLPDISKIEPFQDKDSGRIYGLKLTHDSTTKEVSFLKLQNQLGSSRLRSNDFHINLKGKVVSFEGYGEGHGVGLCLYSAERLAGQGMRADRLLATFFPGSKLEQFVPGTSSKDSFQNQVRSGRKQP